MADDISCIDIDIDELWTRNTNSLVVCGLQASADNGQVGAQHRTIGTRRVLADFAPIFA
jgi:hypothetical protein